MRVFNANEIAMARNVAAAVNVSLSTMLKQLNARYGVQNWEDIIPKQYRVDGSIPHHGKVIAHSLERAANERIARNDAIRKASNKPRKVRSDKGKVRGPRQGKTWLLTAAESAAAGL